MSLIIGKEEGPREEFPGLRVSERSLLKAKDGLATRLVQYTSVLQGDRG